LGFFALAVATVLTGILPSASSGSPCGPWWAGRLRRRDHRLGVDVAVRVVVNGFIGINVRQVGDPWGCHCGVGGISIQQRHIFVFATAAIIVAALFAFFGSPGWATAMRGVVRPGGRARAHGVSVGWSSRCRGRWPAGSDGRNRYRGRDVDGLMWRVALTALPVIILGGLDSLAGAVIGGLAVGVLQELAANYQSHAPWLGGNVSVITPYVVMLLVLLVRPYGLFGTREVERV
jgi:branched-chain amino acid transport system permease protein